MEKQEVTQEDLERLAIAMAKALPELECPDCCECGWVYEYVETSASLYREEFEWACFSTALIRYQAERKIRSTKAI